MFTMAETVLAGRRVVVDKGLGNSSSSEELDLEVMVSWVLIIGICLSTAGILAGLGWHYFLAGSLDMHYNLPKENFFNLTVSTFKQIFTSGFSPALVTTMGIIFLMITPYIRILSSVVYFATVEKNVKYGIYTLCAFCSQLRPVHALVSGDQPFSARGET